MIKYSEDYYEEERICKKCRKKAESLFDGYCKECNEKKTKNLSIEELKQKRRIIKYAMLITFILIFIFAKLEKLSQIFVTINGITVFIFIIEIAYFTSLFPGFWSKFLLMRVGTRKLEKEYCTNCGEAISKTADICYKCGAAPKKIENPKYCKHCGNTITNEQVICLQCKNEIKRGQVAGWGETIISFLIPLIGFIIYATNVSTKKQYAKDCLTCSLIGIGLYVFILLCIGG